MHKLGITVGAMCGTSAGLLLAMVIVVVAQRTRDRPAHKGLQGQLDFLAQSTSLASRRIKAEVQQVSEHIGELTKGRDQFQIELTQLQQRMGDKDTEHEQLRADLQAAVAASQPRRSDPRWRTIKTWLVSETKARSRRQPWERIPRWSGVRKTESFTVDSPIWRIRCSPDQQVMTMSLSVYRDNDARIMPSTQIVHPSPATRPQEFVEVRAEPGRFYLVITLMGKSIRTPVEPVRRITNPAQPPRPEVSLVTGVSLVTVEVPD